MVEIARVAQNDNLSNLSVRMSRQFRAGSDWHVEGVPSTAITAEVQIGRTTLRESVSIPGLKDLKTANSVATVFIVGWVHDLLGAIANQKHLAVRTVDLTGDPTRSPDLGRATVLLVLSTLGYDATAQLGERSIEIDDIPAHSVTEAGHNAIAFFITRLVPHPVIETRG